MTADLDVLQVVTSTHRRGAESFAVDLGAALAGRVTSVETVALRSAPPGEGFDLEALGTDGIGAAVVRRLRRRARGADVVLAHGSSTLWASALATVGGPPFVYRVIGDPTYWVSSTGRRLRVRASLRRAAAVVVYHAAAREALLRLHDLDPAKVHVIGKGVPVEAHPAVGPDERRKARARLGVAASTPVVAWVGALAPEKDPVLALEGVAGLRGVAFLVAGVGPEEDRLRELARQRRLEATFVGATVGARPVMAAADVVVLTSRTEGVPSVLIEAGLCGLATVATDVGGVHEVVQDGVTGFVVRGRTPSAVTTALRKALDDAEDLGHAARERCVDRFAMPPVADRWAQLLGDCAR